MTEEKRQSLHPISEALVRVYNILYENKEVAFPIHDEQIYKIDSVVKTVNAEYFGIVRFPTEADRAAAYLCHIIKAHAVTDGNKRLAILWLEVFCKAVDLHINPPQGLTLDQLAVSIEKESSSDINATIKLVKNILF